MSTTDHARQNAGHNNTEHERERSLGAESPHELLAVDDLSRRTGAGRRTPERVAGGHGVTVQWMRPTELAARVAGHGAAGVIAAHREAHRRLREAMAPRRDSGAGLAPVSAFGRNTGVDRTSVERPVVGR